jgi:hypothetical protein
LVVSPHGGPSDRRKAEDASAGVSKEIAMSEVTVVIGAGSIGQAIAGGSAPGSKSY